MDNPNPNTNADKLTVDPTGSDFNPTTYALAPEDAARGEEILAKFNADPLATPSPVEATEGVKFRVPERFSASILPPDKREAVEKQLAAVPPNLRADREHQLVAEALKESSKELRIKVGVGSGATPLEREQFAVAGDIHRLEKEADAIQDELNEIERWQAVYDEAGKPVIDPDTGQQKMEAVLRVSGERRAGMENRWRELVHRLGLLNSIEGDRRIERALKATIEAEKQRNAQLADRAEAAKRADEILREERIQQQAEALARMRGARS